MVLIFISMMTNEVKHLFIWLFFMGIFSCEHYLSPVPSLLLDYLFHANLLEFFMHFVMSPLSGVRSKNIFPNFVG